MLDTHSGDPQCVLTGSSTHNERVERLWRDVHRCVVHFADTFHRLEFSGLLDTLNEVDMFSLQSSYPGSTNVYMTFKQVGTTIDCQVRAT